MRLGSSPALCRVCLIRFVRGEHLGWPPFDTVRVFGGTPRASTDLSAMAACGHRRLRRPLRLGYQRQSSQRREEGD
jgi:hypothetical protein